MSTSARILVVGDEPNVRLMFRTTLRAAGYVVEEANDGEAALERLGRADVDLILLDLQMPRLDGAATLKSLREGGSNVPVVIVTAHGSIPDAVAAIKIGAIAFLSKPLTPEALRKAVAEVVGRHSRPEPDPVLMPPAVIPMRPADTFADQLKMAKLALGRRSFTEGEFHLKRALALNANSAEAHNLMGILHELRQEQDASYRKHRAALKADRNYVPAKNNLTRYYERFTYGRTQVPLNGGGP